MAHFAEINDENVVLRVLVVNDADEHRGAEFLADDLKLGGTWLQCSYNGRIRKQMPSPGYSYDPTNDVFICPKPYASWTLDANFDWQAPVAVPENFDGVPYWDEDSKSWIALGAEEAAAEEAPAEEPAVDETP